MAKFLTDEWFEVLQVDGAPLEDCTVEISVSGTPGGDLKWHLDVVAGALSAASGASPGADVALTTTYDDLVAMVRGELEPSVAFMQGRMKTAGDPGRLLDVIEATARPDYRAGRDYVLEHTDL